MDGVNKTSVYLEHLLNHVANHISRQFFLVRICYLLLYIHYRTTFLIVFDCISICLYLVLFRAVRRKRFAFFSVTVVLEVTAFMLCNVICLGWNFGFQYYVFSFVIDCFFVGYNFRHRKRIVTASKVYTLLLPFIYLGLYYYTMHRPPIYIISSPTVTEVCHIVNIALTFLFILMFLIMYERVIYTQESVLEEFASKDTLTELFNRRQILAYMEECEKEYKKNPMPVTIAMLDIDDFKMINDSFGHDVGDMVLCQMAAVLRKEQEETRGFYVCRWGGEEFLILYSGYVESREQVLARFERLCETVANKVIKVDTKEIRYSITIGVADYNPGEEMSRTVTRADHNMYEGKRDGKNRVVYH